MLISEKYFNILYNLQLINLFYQPKFRPMANKLANYNSAELKTEINNLSQAREDIEKANDVSGSMVKLNKTLNTIKPLLKKQENYIRNFFTHQQSANGENKQQQTRRYLNRIYELAMNDITDMLDISENYFTLDFKNSWNKIKNAFEKEFNAARQHLDQKNIIDFLFKIMNVKDYFIANFMRSLLYRKCVMWKDLNIEQTGFIHGQEKSVLQLIENERMQKGYIPTKPVFDWMGLDVKGNWNMNKLDVPETNLKNIIKLTNQNMEYVFEVLRNYGNLTVQQRSHEDIDRNRNKIKSLREEIEESKVNYMNLEKKYRQAVLKDERSDLVQMKEKVVVLEQQLESTENELKKIKFQFRDSSNQINSLKQKIKELQADLNRVNNQQMKKLKDLQLVQINLHQQFEKIYKNINNFGTMFQFESDDKKSLAKEIMNQTKTIEKFADILGRERTKNRSLGEEIGRLNKIILELGEKLKRKQDRN